MLQAYFAARPRLRRAWIVGLSIAYLLCWPAVLLLGGCAEMRELNKHDTRGFWRDQEQKLPMGAGLPVDLAEAQRELRSVGF